MRRHEQTNAEPPISGRINLPSDVYNGMTITALKNLRGKTGASIHMVVFNPDPKIYELDLQLLEHEATQNTNRKEVKAAAAHYVLTPKLGWFMSTLASLVRRTIPEYHFWLIKKDAPTFVRFEGSLYPDGPTWIVEQMSPKVK